MTAKDVTALAFACALLSSAAVVAGEPPEGYSWHRADTLHGSFAVPAGWSVEERAEGPWSELYLSAESGDPTRLAIRCADGVASALGRSPTEFARAYMDADFDRYKPLAGSSGREGEYTWFEYTVHKESAPTEEFPDGLDRIARVRILAADARDRVYLLIFETAPSRWNRDKSLSTTLLRSYELDAADDGM